MPNRDLFTRYWSIGLGVLCVIVTLALFFFVQQILPIARVIFLLNIFFIIGLLLIVLGLVRRGVEKVGNQFSESIKHTVSETTKNFWHHVELSDLAKECEQIGLMEIDTDCTNYDYNQILLESRQLVIVLNDGRTWASVHRDRLRRRFADPSKQTTFFLCHPDSPMLQVLARKGSKDVATIKSRIIDTVNLLEEIKQPSTPLEILGHHLFNPYSLIVSDDSAIIIPYFLSRGGRTVPVFKFQDVKDRCYFRYIVEDIERLRMDAENISSIHKNKNSSEGVIHLHPR